MSLEQLKTMDAIKRFLDGTQAVVFNVATHKKERYSLAAKFVGKTSLYSTWQNGQRRNHSLLI